MWYFIDFENVNTNGLLGTNKLTENDTVVLFCSLKNCKMDAELSYELWNAPFDYRLLKGEVTAKNYMDFWLVSECARAVFEEHAEEIAIISKDKGFCSLRDYMLRLNKTVILAPNIATAYNTLHQRQGKEKNQKTKEEKAKQEKLPEPVKNSQELKGNVTLPRLNQKEREQLLEMLITNYGNQNVVLQNRVFEILDDKTNASAGNLHFMLSSAFGYPKGDEIYRFIEKMEMESMERAGKTIRKR